VHSTRVILSLQCSTEVPTVQGMTAARAQDRIESAGLSATFDPKPDRPTDCTVERQDEMTHAKPGSEIALGVSCPLTQRAADGAAQRVVKKDARLKKRRYELDSCLVVTDEEAECGLTFMKRRGVECDATIRVTQSGDTPKATQRDTNCN
jgi:hypothetical protein